MADMVDKMKDIQLPECYFSFQVYWLRKMGIELVKEETLKYRIYSIFIVSFNAIFVSMECIEPTFHKNFSELLMVLNTAISQTFNGIMVLLVYKNRKEIASWIKYLQEINFKPNEDKVTVPYEKYCIKMAIRSTWRLMAGYGIPILVTYIFGELMSLKIRLTEPAETWRMPFIPMSIINTFKSPQFEIAYVFQTIAIFTTSIGIFAADTTIVAVISQITAQFKILEHSIRTYRTQDAENQEGTRRANISTAMKNNINFHCNILDTVERIESVCSLVILVRFVSNIILLCILLYTTATISKTHRHRHLFSLGFATYLSFVGIAVGQVFAYCWSGNEMTLAYERLALAAAEAYTPDDTTFQGKALKLMIIRTQKPLCLTVGKFAPLSLEAFKALIKGSFSYFMVLRQSNADKVKF